MASDLKVQLITPMFRISHPKLDVPKRYKQNGKESGEPKYGVQMVFKAEDLKKFKRPTADGNTLEEVDVGAICKELAAKQWPNLTLAEAFPKQPNGTTTWPLKKGDALIEANAKLPKPKKGMDWLAGMIQIGATANVDYPPRMSFKENGKIVKLDRDNPTDLSCIRKLFKGGNYAVAELSVVPMEVSGKCFIAFYANGIQFRKEGEPLGGQSLLDRFEGIDGGEDEFDPTTEDDFV